MNILVLNSGAKDTALAWWTSKSKLIENLYVLLKLKIEKNIFDYLMKDYIDLFEI